MNASDLVKRIADYGGNLTQIRDCFAGDDELYQDCFQELLNELNVIALRDAVACGNYQSAFNSAHALKGLTANLGLTPLHDALSVLVESLRAQRYAEVKTEYEEVERQWQVLLDCTSERPPQPPAPEAPKRAHVPGLQYVVTTFCVLLTVLGVLFFLLLRPYAVGTGTNALRDLALLCATVLLCVSVTGAVVCLALISLRSRNAALAERDAITQTLDDTRARAELAEASLAEAQHANDAKSRFLSRMSHDIRTPMNAIVNMTHFAREHVRDPRRVDDYLQVVEESSDHLLHLVNDVLDMSRIESGQAVIACQPFYLKSELQELRDIVQPLCDDRKQLFLTDFSSVTCSTVLGDRMKLSQILMNLLSNAIKFTPEKGAVRFVATQLPPDGSRSVRIRFVVEDTGIGISADNIRKIFEPFTRVDDKRINQIEGTGLGLSICESYIEAMGGTLRCDSEEGEGSIFTVELSFQEVADVPQTHIDPLLSNSTPFVGMRCLVVEDNHTNQLIARTLLERLGFIVDTASDGSEAMTKFERSRAGLYDIIYMDIQMPGSDGYQVTIAIRSCPHPQAKTIPIVAMTANVFAEDIEKSRIAGMNGHLSKPITTLELISETSRVMQNPEQPRRIGRMPL